MGTGYPGSRDVEPTAADRVRRHGEVRHPASPAAGVTVPPALGLGKLVMDHPSPLGPRPSGSLVPPRRNRKRAAGLLLVLLAVAGGGAGDAQAAGGGGGAAPPPPPPPPPNWDPARDRVIRIRPDGTRVEGPVREQPAPAPSADTAPPAAGGTVPAFPPPAPAGPGTPGPTATAPDAEAPDGAGSDPAGPNAVGPRVAPGGQAWLEGAPDAAVPPPPPRPGDALPPVPSLSDAPADPPTVTPASAPADQPGGDPWLAGGEAPAAPPPPLGANEEAAGEAPAAADLPAPADVPVPAAVPAPGTAPETAPAAANGEPDPWLVETGSAPAAPPPPPPADTPPTVATAPGAPDPWEDAGAVPAAVPAAPREAPGTTGAEEAWVPEAAPGPDAYPPPGAGPDASPPLAPARPDAGAMRFETPGAVRADEHVRRLLAAPGDAKVPGYPPTVIRHADPGVASERGLRPVVLLFYDDASRASDLQAAEFLPVLVRYADRIDVVPIDISSSTSWSKAERKLVRTYYMASVPTTVVLGADRRPLLLKFQRIDGATLEAKLEANLPPR